MIIPRVSQPLVIDARNVGVPVAWLSHTFHAYSPMQQSCTLDHRVCYLRP